ncbi:MAG: VOC family protein [Deltaproteobacteria bacterium]|nr:VOC family protein [Deltaproteobacteria bacterium]
MTVALGRVMLFTKDTARMRTFYRDLLEVDPIEDSPDWVVFATGGLQLALHALPAHIAAHITVSEPATARSDVAIKYSFLVDDVAATRARLAALGAQMRDSFTSAARTSCDGVDPEGNVFQIASRA